MRVSPPRPSSVVAIAALCLAMGGSATAATLITGAQIKNGSITSADVKNETLALSDLSRPARAKLAGRPGPAGPAGPAPAAAAPGTAGPAGQPGPAGPAGISRAIVNARDDVPPIVGDKTNVALLNLQAGRYILDADIRLASTGSNDVCALTDGSTTLDTFEFTVEQGAIALQGEIAIAEPRQRVAVTCTADDRLEISHIKFRALEVATIE